jgi:hypothetical protein
MASYTPPTSFTTSQATTSAPPVDINPSSLDTLPILAATFARIQATNSTSLAGGSSPYPTSAPSNVIPAVESTTFKETFSSEPLTTKQIPAATDGLKHRLQRTRAQVAQLPDMERTVEEQEEEMRELEQRIRQQRGVLERLKALGSGGDMMKG